MVAAIVPAAEMALSTPAARDYYLGFDLSSRYIELAKKRFPQAEFVCERVSQFSLAKQHSFEVVLALGIVHHLEDEELRRVVG